MEEKSLRHERWAIEKGGLEGNRHDSSRTRRRSLEGFCTTKKKGGRSRGGWGEVLMNENRGGKAMLTRLTRPGLGRRNWGQEKKYIAKMPESQK